LHEYRCLDCGQRTEVLQKFADKPLRICEKCAGRLERLVSAPAIHFKGTGWYVTDYARKGDNGSKPGKATSESSSKSGDDSAKPEKKADSGESRPPSAT
jgi:putative FmdB family regulatory protein